jgi:hypothetical protein
VSASLASCERERVRDSNREALRARLESEGDDVKGKQAGRQLEGEAACRGWGCRQCTTTSSDGPGAGNRGVLDQKTAEPAGRWLAGWLEGEDSARPRRRGAAEARRITNAGAGLR